MPAKAGPEEYIQIAGFEPRISSAYDQIRVDGAVVPPISSGRPSRQYSESMKAWKLFLNVSGTGAVLVSGSKTGGLRSASAKDSASSFSERRGISPPVLFGGAACLSPQTA